MAARQVRVLVAVSPEARGRLAAVLRGYDVTWASDARDAVQYPNDLIVLGSHFAESTALQMLEHIQAASPHARLVCVRGRPFPGLGAATMDAYRAACEALGAVRVIDLLAYPDDTVGNARVRALFDELLTSGAASS